MGGMVAATYNAIYGDDAFAAMVVIATPIDFQDPEPMLDLTRSMVRWSKLIRVIPTPLVARMGIPLPHLPFHADDMLWSAENLDRAARDAMLSSVVSPMTRREVGSLVEMLDAGWLPSSRALPDLNAPLRVIAGRADRVAPVDRVYPYYALAGSAEKDYILAGRANGFSSDYGHLDLVLGDHAAEEIYPLIVAWFADRW
jgi:pimeloyl-ACP methyl ester carboxylesterase